MRAAVIDELTEMQCADASIRPTVARVSPVVGLESLTPAMRVSMRRAPLLTVNSFSLGMVRALCRCLMRSGWPGAPGSPVVFVDGVVVGV